MNTSILGVIILIGLFVIFIIFSYNFIMKKKEKNENIVEEKYIPIIKGKQYFLKDCQDNPFSEQKTYAIVIDLKYNSKNVLYIQYRINNNGGYFTCTERYFRMAYLIK